ncbi:unnamed protein product [Tetraodon nigroviridis]|uniref:Chromosome undetermined SCAF10026, whole genome shotgun sequence n=1 Tax=Tetraodon nigroviridis TaxID=99883 RepID=Q4T3J1_TETNG|nr:unnamed protein product [Tetraodon nigroviridis]
MGNKEIAQPESQKEEPLTSERTGGASGKGFEQRVQKPSWLIKLEKTEEEKTAWTKQCPWKVMNASKVNIVEGHGRRCVLLSVLFTLTRAADVNGPHTSAAFFPPCWIQFRVGNLTKTRSFHFAPF